MNRGNLIMFVIILVTLIAGTIIYYEASAFQKTAKTADGIVSLSISTTLEVTYVSDDGVERVHHASQANYRKRSYGEKLKVFYQAENPDISRIKDGKKGGKNAIIAGFVLLLFNLYTIYNNKKNKKTADSYKTTGRMLAAEILKIDIDMNTTVIQKHPYFIDCRWVDPFTGKEYTHTIRNIWTDPKPLLAGRNSIDVYIDKENPDNYFLDIEFLGPAAK